MDTRTTPIYVCSQRAPLAYDVSCDDRILNRVLRQDRKASAGPTTCRTTVSSDPVRAPAVPIGGLNKLRAGVNTQVVIRCKPPIGS